MLPPPLFVAFFLSVFRFFDTSDERGQGYVGRSSSSSNTTTNCNNTAASF